MTYKVKIKFADDTEKEFSLGSDVELPSGMNLTAAQISSLLGLIQSLTSMMENENWKTVEIEEEP